jgi:hypothetical protein
MLFAAALVLNPHRMQDVFDADFVDGDAAAVGAALDVFDAAGVHALISK